MAVRVTAGDPFASTSSIVVAGFESQPTKLAIAKAQTAWRLARSRLTERVFFNRIIEVFTALVTVVGSQQFTELISFWKRWRFHVRIRAAGETDFQEFDQVAFLLIR